MSTNGLEVFDKTVQTTNVWLNDVMQSIGPDRHVAWKVLSSVLHKLRDRLPVELAAHLGAELPLLIRGVYYDQFTPARQPTRCRLQQFVEEVAEWLSDTRPVDPRDAVRAVFATLSRHVPKGQIEKVRDALPEDIRSFWAQAEAAAGSAAQGQSFAEADAGELFEGLDERARGGRLQVAEQARP